MQLNKESAQKKLQEYNIDDMQLMPVSSVQTKLPLDWFIKYKTICHEFMESLSDSIDDLIFMNLDQNVLISLLYNHILPNELSIRHKIPLLYGGENSVNNLFLYKTFPISYKLDCFILEQANNDIIWIPSPAKKVYTPVHIATGGPGGNATTDILTQIAAQISSSHDIG